MAECLKCADRIAFILFENGNLASACRQKQDHIDRLEVELFATANDLKRCQDALLRLELDRLGR